MSAEKKNLTLIIYKSYERPFKKRFCEIIIICSNKNFFMFTSISSYAWLKTLLYSSILYLQYILKKQQHELYNIFLFERLKHSILKMKKIVRQGPPVYLFWKAMQGRELQPLKALLLRYFGIYLYYDVIVRPYQVIFLKLHDGLKFEKNLGKSHPRYELSKKELLRYFCSFIIFLCFFDLSGTFHLFSHKTYPMASKKLYLS